MSTLILLTVILTTPGDDPAPVGDVASVLSARHQRLARIKSLTCSYTRLRTPSDSFAKSFATGMNVPAAQVKRDQTLDLKCRLDEVQPDRYRYEEISRDPTTGKPGERSVFSHDGKESWRVRVRPIDEHSDSTRAEVGGDYSKERDRSAIIRPLLGDTPLTTGKPPFAEFLEGGELQVIGDEVIDGIRCLVLRRESTENGARSRTTAWFDRGRQFMVLKSQVEYQDKKTRQWFTFTKTTIKEVKSARATGPDGREFLYWYPGEAHVETFNSAGEKSFDDVVKVEELILNREPTDVSFTPRFEDGSTIRDARTGRTTVYGGGPSPRLKQLVDRRVGEGRERLKETLALEPPGAIQPPVRWTSYAPWAALSIGVAGLATALLLRRNR